MEFNRAYNREIFMKFLEVDFLPQDFIKENTPISITHQTNYIKEATKLGVCESLDLVVYEVKHTGKHDPRVGLSKESFKLLAQEWQGKALIAFVPMDSDANYRFSYISIDLDITEQGKIKKSFSNPRRYSYFLGDGIACHTPNKYLNSGRVKDTEDLQSRFSVEVLTKAFYNELSDWYAWAITVVKFPNDIDNDTDDAKYNTESVIRLITRLMFVWFIKQRGLVPNEFFDEAYIKDNLLENFNPNAKIDLFYKSEESKYYKAILQNLFFAMLNSPISPEGKEVVSERRFANGRNDYNNNKLMRYKDKFLNPDLFVELANGTVPFLNGGLFDCLDDKDKGFYIDGFSNREKVQKALVVPDYLFFGEEVGKNIDLSDFYGDKKKKNVSASGIIDILKRYNFTVEENTPFDQDVSLDPELLGKVFENLLASYNPETKTTARKQTGSFYTPREIVQYMVDESLVAHLKRSVGEELEEEYRSLMRYTDEEINLSDEQKRSIIESLYECKVLDPACGSGAFPVGILQQMVHILTQLDPDNTSWKELLLERAVDETTEAFKNSSSEEREAVIKDINHSFDEKYNNPDYSRKLYLIENCIYGVDIQSIAIQISKLRFFISLVVDQKITDNAAKNFGIRPLPNLEAKFVAANTLIGLNKSEATLFDLEQIKELEKELKVANQKIFSVKNYQTKRKYRERVKELRSQISDLLLENDVIGSEQAKQLASWDMFDQNASSPFFDPEWMFGVHDGFDIVIGNPPYINIKNQDEETRIALANLNCSKGADIYVGFIEKGYLFLADNAIQCYIIPNKFFGAAYGKKIRSLIQQSKQIISIWDLKDVKVFENAAISTIVFLSSNNHIDKKCLIKSDEGHSIQDDIFDASGKIQIESTDSDKVFLETICSRCDKLSEIADVRTGVMGFEYWKMEDIITSNSDLTDVNRPIYTNGNLARYNDRWDNTEITLYKDKYYRPTVQLDPEYLNSNTIKLFKHNPKIIVRGVARCVSAIVDYRGAGLLVAVHSIIPRKNNIEALLGIINSKFINWFHLKTYYSQRIPQGSLKYPIEFLASLPVPRCLDEYEVALSDLVNKVCELKSKGADTSALEAKIDQIVYTLYNLTLEEITIIENI